MNSHPQPKSTAIQSEYDRLAPEYDHRWSSYIRRTTEETLCRCPSRPGKILDIGCGTGVLLQELQSRFPESEFYGCDASREMLNVARARLRPQITLTQCWAEALPWATRQFDTVVSANMFHFVRQPETALREMLRVLKPGGTLLITDWCDDYLSCRLCDLYLRLFHDSHHQIYGLRQCHDMLQAADAAQVTVERYRISWLWGMMTAVACKPPEPATTTT